MLFNSIEFLVFFPIVVCAYFMLRHKYRWLMLFIASCIFYAALIPAYLLILFALILVDYTAAILIERSDGKKKKRYLLLSIITTCIILFTFKYFNFFSVNASRLFTLLHWNYSLPLLKLILPLGLSFRTFQSLSYVIEVYRGNQKAERHLGIYALYVMFFPQLVAGPIERPQHLLHQFHEKHRLDYPNVVMGLRRMLFGYFKKMVIADNLAPYVDSVYKHTADSSGNMVIVAMVFFAIQIYCDFSGYSDIAVGAAKIMGFDLMENFKQPYFSKSIGEFWHRWHISLSTWFRDYIYIPLGGSKAGKGRMYYNLFIVFLLSALWHGAGWTFIVWGLLHAFYLVAGNVLQPLIQTVMERSGLRRFSGLNGVAGILFTFLLTCFAWIFFRASDLDNATAIIRHISLNLSTFASDFSLLSQRVHEAFPERTTVLYLVLSLLVFFTAECILYKKNSGRPADAMPRYMRWGLYYSAIAWILLFGVYDITPNFIYFQF